MTKDIAKSHVFDTPEYQGMRGVETANVYDVLRFAMVEKLEIEEANKDRK